MDITPLIAAFMVATTANVLPKGLLDAVCYCESGYTSIVKDDDGGTPSIGICQIKLATAQGMGFTGTSEQLLDPSVNVWYAGKYLRYQLTRYDENVEKAVAAYNAGSHRTNAKGLTVNHKHVKKVLDRWRSMP